MAKFKSSYANQEIENLLIKADTKPFILYYDKTDSKYKLFSNQTMLSNFLSAQAANESQEVLSSYQFTDSFIAPEPYDVTVNIEDSSIYELYGKSSVPVTFNCTVSDKNSTYDESLDATFTINGNVFQKVIKTGDDVTTNVANYLQKGSNTLYVSLKGRTLNVSKTFTVSVYAVELSITCTRFNIALGRAQKTNISIPFSLTGDGEKTVRLYVDGSSTPLTTVDYTSLQYDVNDTITITNNYGQTLSEGLHTFILQATTTITSNGVEHPFESNIIYRQFVIDGEENKKYIVASYDFANGATTVADLMNDGMIVEVEQYTTVTFDWAYFSTVNSDTTQLTWKLVDPAGTYDVTVGSKEASIWETENSKLPDPIMFAASTRGTFELRAFLQADIDIETTTNKAKQINSTTYKIRVVENTNNLVEPTSGLELKLTALGRSNNEPESLIDDWSYYTVMTHFNNMSWNNNCGWVDNALLLQNGGYGYINMRPFSSTTILEDTGYTFEIEFEVTSLQSEDTEVVRIGTVDDTMDRNAYFAITGKQAVFKTQFGDKISTKFTENERLKLDFIIYPKTNTSNLGDGYSQKIFIANNGILAPCIEYDTDDKITIDDVIHIGSATGLCGIKIYSIRCYNRPLSKREVLTNYIIDSSTDESKMNSLVSENDIYKSDNKTLDYDLLQSKFTSVILEGNIKQYMGSSGNADTTYGGYGLRVISPSNPEINMHCDYAALKRAGQSTKSKVINSLKVKLNQDYNGQSNIVYDDNNEILTENRWTFRSGNVPEKKFRLQCNYMDSSGCHNGAFLRMVNNAVQNLQISGEYVLKTPSQRYAQEQYQKAMKKKYAGTTDPSGNDYAFPYTINMVPDSIPCILIDKEVNSSTGIEEYSLIGQYVIMEEKKANYANGMHSIYDTRTSDGYPDPFCVKGAKKSSGEVLWDNAACQQVEIVRDDAISFFNSYADFDSKKEDVFELIYPDPDDFDATEKAQRTADCWNNFLSGFVKPITDTYKDQEAFDAAYKRIGERYKKYGYLTDYHDAELYKDEDGYELPMEKWHFVLYYILVLRNVCSDSFTRNMELTTYDGIHWLPKWWDVDIQCGLSQKGSYIIDPLTDRNDTTVDGVLSSGEPDLGYILAGRIYDPDHPTTPKMSSWLWDGLENCVEFQNDVKTMTKAMSETGGWTYKSMTSMQDDEYTSKWSESIYNENGKIKYIDPSSELQLLQGRMTSNRHWFLKTGYDYYDAMYGVGSYTSQVIDTKIGQSTAPTTFTVTAGSSSFYGWMKSKQPNPPVQIGYGVTSSFEIPMTLSEQDSFQIGSAQNIKEIDFSNSASRIAYERLDTTGVYDTETKTKLVTFNFGLPTESIKTGQVTAKLSDISPLSGFTKCEVFNVQGHSCITSLDTDQLVSLKEFYAAGTKLNAFAAASGCEFTTIELPDTVKSIRMDSCDITVKDKSGNDVKNTCVINFFGDKYTLLTETSGTPKVPYTVDTVKFISMGKDEGVHYFLTSWLKSIDDYDKENPKKNIWNSVTLNCNGLYWEDCTWETLERLAKVPDITNNLKGQGAYIKVVDKEFSASDMTYLREKFGDDIFSSTASLIIDCNSSSIVVSGEKVLSSDVVSSESVTIDEETWVIVSILQGCSAQLKGAKFPIKDTTIHYYTWKYLIDGSDQGTISTTNLSVYLDDNLMDTTTGLVQTVEYNATPYDPDDTYVDYDFGVTTTGGSGKGKLRILNRTYPEEVSLDIIDIDGVVREEEINEIDQEGNVTYSDESRITLITQGTYQISATHYGDLYQYKLVDTDKKEHITLAPSTGNWLIDLGDLGTDFTFQANRQPNIVTVMRWLSSENHVLYTKDGEEDWILSSNYNVYVDTESMTNTLARTQATEYILSTLLGGYNDTVDEYNTSADYQNLNDDKFDDIEDVETPNYSSISANLEILAANISSDVYNRKIDDATVEIDDAVESAYVDLLKNSEIVAYNIDIEAYNSELSSQNYNISVDTTLTDEQKNEKYNHNYKKRLLKRKIENYLRDVSELTCFGTNWKDQITEDNTVQIISAYNGNIKDNGGVWTIYAKYGKETEYVNIKDNNKFDSYITKDSSTDNFNLYLNVTSQIKTLDADNGGIDVKVSYTSTWKDRSLMVDGKYYGHEIDSEEFSFSISPLIDQVLIKSDDNSGNEYLYNLLEDRGYTRANTAIQAFSSTDLGKTIKKDNKVVTTLNFYDTTRSRQIKSLYSPIVAKSRHNILRYTKGLQYLNFNNVKTLEDRCRNLGEDINIVGMANYMGISTLSTRLNVNVGEGTHLEYLRLGTPTYIDIESPYYNFMVRDGGDADSLSVEHLTDLSSIKLINIRRNVDTTSNRYSVYSYTHNEFNRLMNLVFQADEQDEQLCSDLYIEISHDNSIDNDTRPECFNTGRELQRFYYMLSTLHDDSDVAIDCLCDKVYNYQKEAIQARFPDFSITNNFSYIKFKDVNLQEAFAYSTEYRGDGVGIIEDFKTAILNFDHTLSGNDLIEDMSDIGMLTHLLFVPYDDASRMNSDFYGCHSIKYIQIPPNAPYIGRNTFGNLSNILSIDFGIASKLESIQDGAFYECSGHLSVDIIGNANNNYLTELTSVYLSGVSDKDYINVNNCAKLNTLVL